MFNIRTPGIFTLIIFLSLALTCNSQTSYSFTQSQKNEDCTKGAAGINITGLTANDTILITWSNGREGVNSISDIPAGDYSVNIKIKNKLDSTFAFKIEKEDCPVLISNHFTPNGDNYNDTWLINNTQYYPNFEIYVFNKWGQQVHSQKGTYTPWDGTWHGIHSPDGTYYYVFYFDGGNKHKLLKGDVTILR